MEELARRFPENPSERLRGNVIVIGGGIVGQEAAMMAAKMGSQVCLIEISEARRSELERDFKLKNLEILLLGPDHKNYHGILADADVLIAAVHKAGERAPIVIDSDLLKKTSLTKRKIILDIAIDQGGSIAESKPTDYERPLYLDSCGNLRFSVTNMPSLCGEAASLALEKVSLDYTLSLSNGLEAALKRYPELKTGINVVKGEVVHPAVRKAHGLP